MMNAEPILIQPLVASESARLALKALYEEMGYSLANRDNINSFRANDDVVEEEEDSNGNGNNNGNDTAISIDDTYDSPEASSSSTSALKEAEETPDSGNLKIPEDPDMAHDCNAPSKRRRRHHIIVGPLTLTLSLVNEAHVDKSV